jgi:hypothetical protein
VTIYDGWTADGSVVEIQDVFEPVDDDGFVSSSRSSASLRSRALAGRCRA